MPAEKSSKKNPDPKKHRGPSQDQRNNSIAEAVAALKNTIADKADAGRNEQKREDSGNKLIQIATLLFVVATTIGIFIQACIFYNQLSEMRADQRPWVGVPKIAVEQDGKIVNFRS